MKHVKNLKQVNVLGEEVKIKYSMSSHFVMRWHERIADGESRATIIGQVERIMNYGNKVNDERPYHYKVIHEHKCIVVLELSPLNHLLKTVMTV